MSVISNIHTAVVYEPKSTRPMDGQRLVVTIAKKDKDGNYGEHLQQTMATSIPALRANEINWTSALVQDACLDYFRSVQNSIVSDKLKSGKREIRTEDLSQAAIIDYINSDTIGDKWDASRIAAWFTDYLAEYVGVALIEKGMADDKVEASLKAYEALISQTLGTKGVIGKQKAVAIKKAFDLVPTEAVDGTLAKFKVRIDKVLEEKVGDLNELLGL